MLFFSFVYISFVIFSFFFDKYQLFGGITQMSSGFVAPYADGILGFSQDGSISVCSLLSLSFPFPFPFLSLSFPFPFPFPFLSLSLSFPFPFPFPFPFLSLSLTLSSFFSSLPSSLLPNSVYQHVCHPCFLCLLRMDWSRTPSACIPFILLINYIFFLLFFVLFVIIKIINYI